MSQINIDLAALRERLKNTKGKEYWRSLDELADTDEFQELLRQEYPRQAALLIDPLTRRTFLKLLAASLALAGLSACGGVGMQPAGKILPYVHQPEEIVPGRPLYFATAMPLSGYATGLLVESHTGRPTKVEGNPDHPASLGASDIFAQAFILDLYDPDRSQTILNQGRIRSFDAFSQVLAGAIDEQRGSKGAGLRILTQSVTSPTLASQMSGILSAFPSAKWVAYEPINRDNVHAGAMLAFGQPVEPVNHLDKADVVLSLDADLFEFMPGRLRYARDFAGRRRADTGQPPMNRVYAVESTMTLLGAKADHRLPLPASQVEAFARAVASAVGVAGISGQAPSGVPGNWMSALTSDLRAHRGTSLVIAGEHQPPVVHALAHAINDALGSAGNTVTYLAPVQAGPTDQLGSLRGLVDDMNAGRVQLLLILGGNPVYNAPVDLNLGSALGKVPVSIHLGMYQDETSALCSWHIPEAHPLETWSDARAYDGTATIMQPLIAPLYGGRSAHELLGAFSQTAASSGHDIVQSYWRGQPQAGGGGNAAPAATPTAAPSPTATTASGAASPTPGAGATPAAGALASSNPAFDSFWRNALNTGTVPNTTATPASVTLRTDWAANLPAPAANGQPLELVFRPDPSLYDGRFANNGWLQELPKPFTRITWDNVARLSPTTAQRMGVQNGDLIDLTLQGRRIRFPAWVLPGQPDNSITVTLGYGRKQAGKVGNGVGVNAYALRTSSTPWIATGLQVTKSGEQYNVAAIQRHNLIEGRSIIRATTLSEYQKNPNFAKEQEPSNPLSLYPPYQYPGDKWAMAIDLSTCIGCQACVVACQAENNIPVVGKDQVLREREMHWLRVDNYFTGNMENPQTYFQPVPCMQCETAPCEVVCPVAATEHSSDGLNDMVYNRCVGTRYCSNNCPYKVRRFNFLQFSDWTSESVKAQRNPDVTVRSRGVMEKCTYCVQRIRRAQVQAEKEGRSVRDGEVITACAAACPADAIIFGNLNDPNSRVVKLKASPRDYALLAELNTRPRTTYEAAIRNPNSQIT